LLAAAVVYLMPPGWLASLSALSATTPAASPSATASETMPPGTVVEPVAITAVTPADAAASALPGAAPAASAAAAPVANIAAPAPPAAGSAPLQLRAKAPSWIEVQDANSQVLLSRHLQPGETVQVDGTLPMRVKIGNAGATELVFRGQPLDLTASTRDNVARVELK
ncbi:MAG TPA: DUF4115 domain-containing protein, partial [Albitalea sp.]|nr:DUF4115 domain-containing protein [Albitalea sp.]